MKKRKTLYIIITVFLFVITGLLVYKFYPKSNNSSSKIITKDTEKPIIDGVKDLVTTRGKEINLLDGVTASDNETKNLEIKVVGTYDFDKVGTYNLKYVCEDESNNVAEKDFSLTVEVPKPVVEADGATYVDEIIIVNKTYGVPSTYEPNNLKNVGKAKMVDYAADALQELINAASGENIYLFSMTGYRSYSFQSSIYNGYLKEDTRESVDTYSARPGYSEHHTGLAVDLNSLDQAWGNTIEGIWLYNNCYKYGFILRYPKGKENITGYMYEPWHIRYVGTDLAEILYNDGDWITLEEYYNLTSEYQD